VSSSHFFIAILDILASLPREVLLLLKTNDLLRAVDNDLLISNDPAHHIVKTLGNLHNCLIR
jgi:hypothetical protein